MQIFDFAHLSNSNKQDDPKNYDKLNLTTKNLHNPTSNFFQQKQKKIFGQLLITAQHCLKIVRITSDEIIPIRLTIPHRYAHANSSI
jgi:hypothetical protein